MKKFFRKMSVQAGLGFTIGWVVGRGTAVGPQSGEILIGGIVVGIITAFIYQIILDKVRF